MEELKKKLKEAYEIYHKAQLDYFKLLCDYTDLEQEKKAEENIESKEEL